MEFAGSIRERAIKDALRQGRPGEQVLQKIKTSAVVILSLRYTCLGSEILHLIQDLTTSLRRFLCTPWNLPGQDCVVCFFFFCSCHLTCGILVPNHGTAREFPKAGLYSRTRFPNVAFTVPLATDWRNRWGKTVSHCQWAPLRSLGPASLAGARVHSWFPIRGTESWLPITLPKERWSLELTHSTPSGCSLQLDINLKLHLHQGPPSTQEPKKSHCCFLWGDRGECEDRGPWAWVRDVESFWPHSQ